MNYHPLLTTLFMISCIPVPYLTPPVHVGFDVYSNPKYDEGIDNNEEPFESNLAVGITPLGLSKSTKDRPVDAYGGIFIHSSERIGPFVGAEYWPIVKPLGQRGAFRFGLTGRAALMGANDEWGSHYRAGITAELASYIKAKDGVLYQKDHRSIGVMFGEAGIGMDLCVFVDDFDDDQLIGSMLTLDFRLPAGAGVSFVPITNFSK